MGEMIKFGIKMAMIIACGVALTAALLTLFNLITSAIASFTAVAVVLEIFAVFSVVLPFNMGMIMTALTALMSFKVAFWASDKLIELIGAIG